MPWFQVVISGEIRLKLTPFVPRPGVSPNSATVRSSSFCKTSFLVLSASVVVGRAKIHFCITVHTFGVPISGVMALIALIVPFEKLGSASDREKGSPRPGSSVGVVISLLSATTGNRACHSPRRRATARQTSSRLRSSGVQTRPRMNLYRSPF